MYGQYVTVHCVNLAMFEVFLVKIMRLTIILLGTHSNELIPMYRFW